MSAGGGGKRAALTDLCTPSFHGQAVKLQARDASFHCATKGIVITLIWWQKKRANSQYAVNALTLGASEANYADDL